MPLQKGKGTHDVQPQMQGERELHVCVCGKRMWSEFEFVSHLAQHHSGNPSSVEDSRDRSAAASARARGASAAVTSQADGGGSDNVSRGDRDNRSDRARGPRPAVGAGADRNGVAHATDDGNGDASRPVAEHRPKSTVKRQLDGDMGGASGATSRRGDTDNTDARKKKRRRAARPPPGPDREERKLQQVLAIIARQEERERRKQHALAANTAEVEQARSPTATSCPTPVTPSKLFICVCGQRFMSEEMQRVHLYADHLGL